VRRAAGLVVVGAMVAAATAAARSGADGPEVAVATTPATAWLPGIDPDHLVLADADAARGTTNVKAPGVGPVTPVQVGMSALAVTDRQLLIASGRTWQLTTLRTPTPAAFAVGGPTAAWLVAPETGTAWPVDADGLAVGLGEPRSVGPGPTPGRVRVGDDGTLWVLDPGAGEVRAVTGAGQERRVALDALGPDPALTVVDGDPVVIGAGRARHIDPAAATVDRDWPVDLPPGPVEAAERTRGGVAVARAGHRLTVTAPDRAPLAVDLDDGADGVPVEHDGHVYLPDARTGTVLALDTRHPGGTPPVRRVAVPGRGDLRLVAHHDHLWYLRYQQAAGGEGPSVSAGVVAADGTARPIDTSDLDPEGTAGPTRPGRPTGEGAGDGPGTPDPTRRPTAVPAGLDPQGEPCARTWTSARCLPDDDPRPGARGGPRSAADCPLTWPAGACPTPVPLPGPPGAPGGPGGAGAPGVDFSWWPTEPARGQDVTFTLTGAPAGAVHWSFADGQPASADGTGPTARWATSGHHRVRLTVEGSPTPLDHDVVVGNLPPLTGLEPAAAADILGRAGLKLGEPRLVPALQRAGTVVAVRFHGERTAPDDVPAGATVTLDIADGTKPVAELAGSDTHRCARTLDGVVYCWGANRHGVLGDGTLTGSATPVSVDRLGPAIAIASAGSVACAIVADHSVWCWGDNEHGQVGDGSNEDRLRPAPVRDLHDAVEIATNGATTCAVRADRSLWCWGLSHGFGAQSAEMLGPDHPEDSPVPVPVGITGVAHVSLNGQGCATLTDGTARCWGLNAYRVYPGDGDGGAVVLEPVPGGLTTVPGLTDALDVRAGGSYACALRAGGTVSCWGTPGFGQVSPEIPEPAGYVYPEPVPLEGPRGVRQLVSGDFLLCALLADRTVACWGTGPGGTLGDGATTNSPVPRPALGISSAVTVAATRTGSCAILDDGSLHCWGLEPDASGGGGTRITRTPTRVPVGTVP
jgi:hypothetical protein